MGQACDIAILGVIFPLKSNRIRSRPGDPAPRSSSARSVYNAAQSEKFCSGRSGEAFGGNIADSQT
jgi:hypothetical protein